MLKTTWKKGNELKSTLKRAKEAGKGTGIVTTTRINHASPTGAYANSAYRFWYDDTELAEYDMPEEKKAKCVDLAKQFVNNQPLIDVAMGGGYKDGFIQVLTPTEKRKIRDPKELKVFVNPKKVLLPKGKNRL